MVFVNLIIILVSVVFLREFCVVKVIEIGCKDLLFGVYLILFMFWLSNLIWLCWGLFFIVKISCLLFVLEVGKLSIKGVF